MNDYEKKFQQARATIGEIDKEVKSIVDDCYAKAKQMLLDNRDVLERCAQLLLEKEKIGQEEFEALFEEA